MERWTIAEPYADRFRIHLNFGGHGYWCMFDYEAVPAPAQEGIDVVIGADPDADTVRWFSDLKRGMEAGWAALQEHYEQLLAGVRIVVTRIHAHPVATTAQGCEQYGRNFIVDLGRHRAVRATRTAVEREP